MPNATYTDAKTHGTTALEESNARYVAERNAMLTHRDIDLFVQWAERYGAKFSRQEVAEIAFYKCISAIPSLSGDLRATAEAWLAARGYASLSGGSQGCMMVKTKLGVVLKDFPNANAIEIEVDAPFLGPLRRWVDCAYVLEVFVPPDHFLVSYSQQIAPNEFMDTKKCATADLPDPKEK